MKAAEVVFCVLCGGEVWCRELLFPAFQEQVCWGFLQWGIGASGERLLRCSTLPLTKNLQLLYGQPARITTPPKSYRPLLWEILVYTSFCLAGLPHIVLLFCTNWTLHLKQSLLGNVFLFLSSERNNRIALLEQLYFRAPRALLIPGCITVYTKCF